MVRALRLAVAITLIVPACSRRDAAASDSAAAIAARDGDAATRAGADTATRAGADTPPGAGATATTKGADTSMIAPTAFGKMVVQMMESMEAQMRVMDTASAATMQARMPRYVPMGDSLIARMNEELRRMNIPTDAIWPATVDSLRQDLGRLRATTTTDSKAMMPAHLKRMRWLIQMQRTMTGKTPP
jgi:hypothetical protein